MSDRGRRLCVSLVAAILVVAAAWVPVPLKLVGLVGLAFEGRPGPPFLAVFAFGLGPWTGAAIGVELLAAVVPRWRALRLSGPAGRARLWRATALLGIGLALLQSFFMVRFLRRSDAIANDPLVAAIVMSTLTAGAALTLAAAWAVTRFGLGNGFSVLLVSAAIEKAITSALRAEPVGDVDGPVLVKRLLLLLVIAAFIAWALLRERRRATSGDGLPFPASGTSPLGFALSLPTQLANIATFAVLPWLSDIFRTSSPLTQVVEAAVIVAGTFALSWAFNRPKQIAATVPEPTRALLGGAARAAVFLLLLGASQTALTRAGAPLDVITLLVFVAVALDLHAEWKASAGGKLVPVWPMARPYAVDAALAKLRAAGIAAHPRALHHRALLQAFGPYLTVDLLVPEPSAVEARQILEAL